MMRSIDLFLWCFWVHMDFAEGSKCREKFLLGDSQKNLFTSEWSYSRSCGEDSDADEMERVADVKLMESLLIVRTFFLFLSLKPILIIRRVILATIIKRCFLLVGRKNKKGRHTHSPWWVIHCVKLCSERIRSNWDRDAGMEVSKYLLLSQCSLANTSFFLNRFHRFEAETSKSFTITISMVIEIQKEGEG